jgi:LacI family gluconate utilization system Gnt-I transcriptional repressor
LVVIAEDSPEQGMSAATQLLAQARRPEAVLCLAGDRSALGILREARLRHLSVPGDLAVAGWGDQPFAAWVEQELTTVSAPWEDLGIRSALTLARRASRKDLPRIHRTVDARAVVRRSG